MWRGSAASAVRPLRSRRLSNSTQDPPMVAPTTLARVVSSAASASTALEAAVAVLPQAGTVSNVLRHYGTRYRRFSEGHIRLFTVPQRQLLISPLYPTPLASRYLMSAPYLTATSQTKAFESYVGNTLHFIDELENDKQSCHKDLSADNLKMLYEEKVKQALELRCLLSPYSLDGIDAASLHFSYKDIIGDFPKYMTSFDLMINLKMTAEVHWGPYLDYLSQERMLIVEDWTNRLYTGSVATLCNDGLLGVPFDEDKGLFFRGEAGAYVKGEKTNLSFIISLGKQIHRSQIYYGVPCMKDDCIQAEVFAMYLLLKRGIELGLHTQ